VVDSCTICSSRTRRPVRKLLETPSCDASMENGKDPAENKRIRIKWTWECTSAGLDVNEKIIWEQMLEKRGVKVWTGFIWLSIRTSDGILWTRWCTFGFHKESSIFFNKMSDYQLFRWCPVPCSKYSFCVRKYVSSVFFYAKEALCKV